MEGRRNTTRVSTLVGIFQRLRVVLFVILFDLFIILVYLFGVTNFGSTFADIECGWKVKQFAQ